MAKVEFAGVFSPLRYNSPRMRVLVGHHDWCFDGVASAALFTRLHRHVEGEGHDYSYLGLSHGPVKSWSEELLTGERNAVVDFRFLASPRLHWWFDHHRTAFELPGDEEAFRRDTSGRMFFDPGKAVRELGLPRTPVREAFADGLRWFAERGYFSSSDRKA